MISQCGRATEVPLRGTIRALIVGRRSMELPMILLQDMHAIIQLWNPSTLPAFASLSPIGLEDVPLS